VAEAVDGKVLSGVEAMGKNLLLRFEGGVTVRSHLRTNGRWRIVARGSPRTGRPWLVLRGRDWEAVQWNGPVLTLDGEAALRSLGPDLLADSTVPAALVDRLRTADPRRLLGEALVDQRLVAGIGNIWLAEALWQARISPWLRVGEATDEELRRALEWARSAMRAAVSGPRPLRFVYRRAGRPCRRCGESIASRGLGDANRAAYWCPRCQRGPARSGGVQAGEQQPPA
jgi:endonuclease-8